MEEESESCRSSDEGLPELSLHCISDNGFHVWACVSIEVRTQLSVSSGEEEEGKKQYYHSPVSSH